MLGCPDIYLRYLGASNTATVAHAEADIEAVASGPHRELRVRERRIREAVPKREQRRDAFRVVPAVADQHALRVLLRPIDARIAEGRGCRRVALVPGKRDWQLAARIRAAQ